MLRQTAIGFEQFLIFNRGHDADNIHDLIQLPCVGCIEPGEPGTLAMEYIKAAIEEHGIDADGITGYEEGYLRSDNLPELKSWAETADLLMLDIILWTAIPAWRRRDRQLAKD